MGFEMGPRNGLERSHLKVNLRNWSDSSSSSRSVTQSGDSLGDPLSSVTLLMWWGPRLEEE